MNMRTLSIKSSLLSIAFALCSCRTAQRADGSYRLEFVWDGGLRDVKVFRKGTDKEAAASFREELLTNAEPVVANEMKKSNLVKARGTLDVSASGPPPYTFVFDGVHISNPDLSELFGAVDADDTEKIRTLVSRDQNVNERELPSQRSALFMAAAGGRQRSLQTLLELGAGANMCDFENDSPLHAAVVANSEQSVKSLISAGANVDHPNAAGVTPMMAAAQLGRIAILELLLRSGAKVNLKSASGETAESIARDTGNLKAASILQHFSERNQNRK